MTPLIIIGCGYIGTRLARAALAQGRRVRVCGRATGRMAPLAQAGAEVKYLDVDQPKQIAQALASLPGATVVYSVPAVTKLQPGVPIKAALQAAYGANADAFIMFSSSGLYGAEPDDDTWIDEDSPIANNDHPMSNVLSDEREVDVCPFDRLRTVILRLAPVYGPGRGVRARIRKGEYRVLDDGSHVTSRIHVDDVVQVVFAAEQKAQRGARYLVADDQPTTQGEYAKWLSERMGVAMPGTRAMFEPGAPRIAHRNRKIRNTRLKTELGIAMKYPSFREGEAQIEVETGEATGAAP